MGVETISGSNAGRGTSGTRVTRRLRTSESSGIWYDLGTRLPRATVIALLAVILMILKFSLAVVNNNYAPRKLSREQFNHKLDHSADAARDLDIGPNLCPFK